MEPLFVFFNLYKLFNVMNTQITSYKADRTRFGAFNEDFALEKIKIVKN